MELPALVVRGTWLPNPDERYLCPTSRDPERAHSRGSKNHLHRNRGPMEHITSAERILETSSWLTPTLKEQLSIQGDLAS